MTQKQKIFVDEYLIDLNATRAYMAAYSKVKNPNVAAASAARMLRNVKVAKEIQKRMNERSERTEITQDMVLKELAALALAKYTDYGNVIERQAYYTKNGMSIPLTDKNGKPLMIKDIDYNLTAEMSEYAKKAIKSIKPGKYGIELELYDKERALEMLGRHLGMFTGKAEEPDDNSDDGFIEALKSTAREDWADED